MRLNVTAHSCQSSQVANNLKLEQLSAGYHETASSQQPAQQYCHFMSLPVTQLVSLVVVLTDTCSHSSSGSLSLLLLVLLIVVVEVVMLEVVMEVVFSVGGGGGGSGGGGGGDG